MEFMIGARPSERGAPDNNEMLVALVHQIMAECRAHLAAEDAAR